MEKISNTLKQEEECKITIENTKNEEKINLDEFNNEDVNNLKSNTELKQEGFFMEPNSDSNKSQQNFHITNNLLSSSGSNKDSEHMTPKSMHNLNLLFNECNTKKNQGQKFNNHNIDISPFFNRVQSNFPYNFPTSPIDPNKISSSSREINISKFSNTHSSNTQVFNNEGNMSINIENKYIYDIRGFGNNSKKFNRKIEFTSKMKQQEDMNNNLITESSEDQDNVENVIKKPQAIIPKNIKNINDSLNTPIIVKSLPVYSGIKNHTNSLPRINIRDYQIKKEEELQKKKFSCKCKKSKCLKLYCECFANGEFCIDCNCVDCSNVIWNEDEKVDAFNNIKDKNPVAMKLNNNKEINEENIENKIGCNCTKSNCSKKYCECYKANVQCSEQCRCRDCGNSSSKCKEVKDRLRYKYTEDLDMEIYRYDDFAFEKISVLIENKAIIIEKKLIKNINQSVNDDIKSLNNKCSALNSAVIKKYKDSFLIEINKSLLDVPLNFSETPRIHKFKKRTRDLSIDSYNSNPYLNLINTACETSTKKNNKKSIAMSKVIGKKLILDS